MTPLPPLDDLPRQDPPPSDDELAGAYVPALLETRWRWAVPVAIAELTLIVVLQILILLAQ